MKTYYWRCEKKNGKLAEGKFSIVRRAVGRLFMGEKFTKLGEWNDEL